MKARTTAGPEGIACFEEAVLPHLDAAYNLARWLSRNDQDAEDVLQEASLRALKYWGGFSGRDCRSWLLAIVRNTYYSWLQHRSVQPVLTSDGEIDDVDHSIVDAEKMLIQSADKEAVQAALEKLSTDFREAVVLRDMEELSYKEIADVLDIPIGTVMSRLSRARKQLQRHFAKAGEEV